MQLVIDMYDPEHDAPYAGVSTRDAKVSICTLQGICLTILGHPQSGAAISLAGVTHAETLDHPISLILGLRRACLQAMVERNVERVTQLADRLLRMGSAYETFKGGLEGAIFYDWAALQRRPERAALDRILASLHKFDNVGNWALLPFHMASAAQLFGEHGDPATAMSLLQRAAELVGITGERWCEAEILRLQARLGAPDAADALLRRSLAQAKEQGAKLWVLRTATSLAELWHEQGNASGARELLAPISRFFPRERKRGRCGRRSRLARSALIGGASYTPIHSLAKNSLPGRGNAILVTHNRCYATYNDFCRAVLHFLREEVPKNWAILCDSVTDNFRIISPADFRVLKA